MGFNLEIILRVCLIDFVSIIVVRELIKFFKSFLIVYVFILVRRGWGFLLIMALNYLYFLLVFSNR